MKHFDRKIKYKKTLYFYKFLTSYNANCPTWFPN